jgi:hypothetical protein
MTAKRAGVRLLQSLPFLLVAAVAWYQLPGPGPWKPGDVVAFRYSGYTQAAFGASLVVWGFFLVTLLWRGLAARIYPARWHRWCLISAFVAIPLLGLLALGARAVDGREVCQLRLQDDSVYHVRRSLPAYLLTLEVSRGLLSRQERIIGYGDAEFPALLVRPTGGIGHDRQPPSIGAPSSLVQSADGRWLAVLMALEGEGPDEIPSCQTHLVYDLSARKVYEVNDFLDLSPFILVGPRDHLTLPDVRALLAGPGKVRAAGLALMRPSPATIARDLGNPNPEVRAAAARLLDTQNTENSYLEDAADILRQSATLPDPIARDAAKRALERLKALPQ